MGVSVAALVLPFLCWGLAFCSQGDRSAEFRSCVMECARRNCSGEQSVRLPLHLRVLRWSCEEDCAYHCMHRVTQEDLQRGRRVRQFYGKWPFIRVSGIQEPASAVFSVLNGVTLLYGYCRFRSHAPSNYPLHTLLALQIIVYVHAWFWSAVFHSRDTYWTEKLDYFSAASLIVCSLIVQFVRLTGPSAVVWQWLYGSLWVGLFTAHVGYLSLVKFDYGYNMAASVGAGAIYAAVWVLWCIKNRKERRYVWKCVAVVLATVSFLSLELLDFPPIWWVFDAHSLWHLSTVPLPLLWYSFLTDDAKFGVQQLKKSV